MHKTSIFIEKARAKHGDRYDYSRVVYVRSRDKVVITCAKHGDFEQEANSHLRGSGCAECGKESRAIKQSEESNNSFIERSRDVHGDRYSYDRVVYVRNKDKVIITCKKHGDFEQTPTDHLSGKGCAKCGRYSAAAKQREDSKNSFIERSRAVHGDLYDYSKAVYTRSHDKVIIICTKHGDFEQKVKIHLQGKGCAKCGRESMVAKQSEEAKDSFIERSREKHGDLYGYERVVYVRNSDNVVITCKQHGDFEQRPNHHLRGQGCPSCPKRYDQPTNLYLMHNGLGKVKVGYSIDVDVRISQLNQNAPFEAELLETWTLTDTPTVRKIEGKVHRKLAKYHAGLSGFEGATEWFDTTPERAKAVIMKSLMGAEVLGHSEADSLQLALI